MNSIPWTKILLAVAGYYLGKKFKVVGKATPYVGAAAGYFVADLILPAGPTLPPTA